MSQDDEAPKTSALSRRRFELPNVHDPPTDLLAHYRGVARRFTTDSLPSRFDPVDFALEALRLLKPRRLSVVVRTTPWELRVDSGTDWASGPEHRWAMLSIPSSATREAILLRIFELTRTPWEPFFIDLVFHHLRHQTPRYTAD